ncbi:MAG: acyl-CoA thioesterase [Actinomycetota bacterium]|nr:acyl-CoA thioesterase [Actinomycetota bacterium]
MDLDAAGQSVARSSVANDPVSEWMDILVLDRKDGQATIQMTLRQEMLNGFGIAHGGMIFAFGDAAFALACNAAEADGSTITVATGVDINFIRSARVGQTLTAVASRRSLTGRSGIYDVQITATSSDGGEDVLAELRGRSRTIAGPGAPTTSLPESASSQKSDLRSEESGDLCLPR